MQFKFKNGYTVHVIDDEKKSRGEVFRAASAVVKVLDAELSRNINTNVSFSIDRIRKAIKELHDIGVLNPLLNEYGYLMRDINTDLDKHENYKNTFHREVLQAVVDKYTDALNLIKKDKEASSAVDVKELEDKIAALIELWFDVTDSPVKDSETGDVQLIVEYDYNLDENVPLIWLFHDIKNAKKRLAELKRQKVNKDGAKFVSARIEPFKWPEGDRKTPITFEDMAPPFYDPTEYPAISGSDYSIERLKKEVARHDYDNTSDFTEELHDVIFEINEFIRQGRQALIDAGWTKLDARYAIESRYEELLKLMRESKDELLQKEADNLEQKIFELKKAWDLVR